MVDDNKELLEAIHNMLDTASAHLQLVEGYNAEVTEADNIIGNAMQLIETALKTTTGHDSNGGGV